MTSMKIVQFSRPANPHPLRPITYHFCLTPTPHHFKLDALFVSPPITIIKDNATASTQLLINDCHCVKNFRIRSYSSSYFPAFGLNTVYLVSLRIQSECKKIRTRMTTNMDHFYPVCNLKNLTRVSIFYICNLVIFTCVILLKV